MKLIQYWRRVVSTGKHISVPSMLQKFEEVVEIGEVGGEGESSEQLEGEGMKRAKVYVSGTK